jgi:hypothetical protein
MDRLTVIDQARIDELRQNAVDASATEDAEKEPLDRRDREHVAYYQDPSTSEWLPTALKRDDDVIWAGVIPSRVVGPAEGREWLQVYHPDLGDMVYPIHWSYVSDRAPLDTQEAPLPIGPSEPQSMMRVAASAEGAAMQPKHEKGDAREQLEAAIAHLTPEQQKTVRQYAQKHRKG